MRSQKVKGLGNGRMLSYELQEGRGRNNVSGK